MCVATLIRYLIKFVALKFLGENFETCFFYILKPKFWTACYIINL
jgi:hypothetical protein